MFTWILIIAGVLLIAGLAWSTIGMAPKGVNQDDVRNIKYQQMGKGEYHGRM